MRGRDCYTYYDSAANWTTPTWVQVAKVIDESEGLEADVAEGYTRESMYQDVESVGLKFSANFTYRYAAGPTANDTVLAAFKAALVANTTLFMAFLDGPVATAGSEGAKVPVKVTKVGKTRNVGDMVEVDISVQGTRYDDSGTAREYTNFVAS